MAAQLGSATAWAKLLLYRRDGAPFWALVHACPLWPAPAAADAAAQQKGQGDGKQQPPPQPPQQAGVVRDGSSGASSSGGGGGATSGLQLLLLADVTSQRLKRLGKYVMGRVLGQGASGVVRVGKNPSTGGAGRNGVGGGRAGALRLASDGRCGPGPSRCRRAGASAAAPATCAPPRNARAGELVAIKTVDATRFRSLAEIEQVRRGAASRPNQAC
jgi:hypothetical protein